MMLGNIPRRRTALVVGCGPLGASLAKDVYEHGYDVTVVDSESPAFRHLDASFGGFTLLGDATDIAILEKAGLSKASLVLAVTDNDNCNVFIAEVAARIFGCASVFARLDDDRKEALLEGFNIEVLCSRLLCERQFVKSIGFEPEEGEGR